MATTVLGRDRLRPHLVISRFAALAVSIIGLLVLAGWFLDNEILKSVLPGLVTMKVNTALGLIVAGISLGLLSNGQSENLRQVGHGLALAVTVLGSFTLSEHLLGWNLGIDEFLFPQSLDPQSAYPGRMSLVSALNFGLLGLALVFLDVRPRIGPAPSELLVLGAGSLSLAALLGHAYDIPFLYQMGSVAATALNTTVAFGLLCLGILFARPNRGFMGMITSDSSAGIMVRRLIPAAIIVPAVLGYLTLVSERAEMQDGTISIGILVLSTTLAGLWVIYWTATLLHREDGARKRAEHQMEESSQTLSSVIDASPLPIVSMDKQGKVLIWNRAAERVFGWSAHEAVGHLNPLTVGTEEDYGRVLDRVIRGEVVIELDVVRQKKDGSPISVNISAAPVLDVHGQIGSTVAVFTDIGERKLLEQQLLQAQKMEAIGTLAGGVAHDFNNMLTIILGYADLMTYQLAEDHPMLAKVRGIHDAAQRASSLTRQLLTFSRKHILQLQVLDLNVSISEFEKMLKRIIGEDIEFRVVLDPDLGRVKADSSQIEQMIMNLVVNARDSMTKGGFLTIETSNVELDQSYCDSHSEVLPGRYCMLAISDTGSGMDRATMNRIFEPFFTTKESGTGLGLSTVYGIVKQSGGSIWVYSELLKGTTFKIYLPQVDEPFTGVDPLQSSRSLNGSEVILLVEDDETLGYMAAEVLRGAGYSVLEARSGMEALRVCFKQQGTIHLVVTDVIMPKMNGQEVAERLLELRPEIRVLFISGYTDETIAHHGILQPGTHFLQKPFAPRALLEMVRKVLDTEGTTLGT